MNKKYMVVFLAAIMLLFSVCFSLSMYLYKASFNADAISKEKYRTAEAINAFYDYPWNNYNDSLPEIKDADIYYYTDRNASFWGFVSSSIEIDQADTDNAIVKNGDNGFIFITGIIITDIKNEEFTADVALKDGSAVSIRISGDKQTANNNNAEKTAEQILKEFNDFKPLYYSGLWKEYSIESGEGMIFETQPQVYDISQTKLIRLIFAMRDYDTEPLYMLIDQSAKAETVVKDGLIYFLAEGTSGRTVLIYDCFADIWREMTVYK